MRLWLSVCNLIYCTFKNIFTFPFSFFPFYSLWASIPWIVHVLIQVNMKTKRKMMKANKYLLNWWRKEYQNNSDSYLITWVEYLIHKLISMDTNAMKKKVKGLQCWKKIQEVTIVLNSMLPLSVPVENNISIGLYVNVLLRSEHSTITHVEHLEQPWVSALTRGYDYR